jgi:Tol biopolymer transport system component
VSQNGKPKGDPKKITLPRSGFNMSAGWTSDNKIGFKNKEPIKMALYMTSASGGEVTHIANVTDYWYPKWSPDGEKIYYYERSKGEILSISLKEGQVHPIPIDYENKILTPGLTGLGLDVSPDGKKLVFSGLNVNKFKSEKEWIQNIFTVPSKGGKAVQLTQESFSSGNPAWSPDGEQIAFISQQNITDEQGSLCLISAQGGDIRKLTSSSVKVRTSPIWSPDGKSIAYLSTDNKIKMMTLEGEKTEDVVEVKNFRRAGNFDMTWSPDGERIAYTPGQGSIWVISLDNGKPIKVDTQWDGTHSHIDWSPEGKNFLFGGVTGGEVNLWVIEDFLPFSSEMSRGVVDYEKVKGTWELGFPLSRRYYYVSLDIEEEEEKLKGTLMDFFKTENIFLSDIDYNGKILRFEFTADLPDEGEYSDVRTKVKAEFKVSHNKLEGFLIFKDLDIKAPVTGIRKQK